MKQRKISSQKNQYPTVSFCRKAQWESGKEKVKLEQVKDCRRILFLIFREYKRIN